MLQAIKQLYNRERIVSNVARIRTSGAISKTEIELLYYTK